jgi:hypothetical protein
MQIWDHRQRVAAERRERIRARLLASAMTDRGQGPAATSIDTSSRLPRCLAARSTNISPHRRVGAWLAIEIANELSHGRACHATIQQAGLQRHAARRPGIDHPLAATPRAPQVAGRPGPTCCRVRPARLAEASARAVHAHAIAALNIVAGSFRATHCMLEPGCEHSRKRRRRRMRALGIDAKRRAHRPAADASQDPAGEAC